MDKNTKKLSILPRAMSRDLVGIEFTNSALKISHIKSIGNTRELVNLLHKDISGLPDTDCSQIILTSLQQLNVKNPFVIMIIPAQSVITKNIEVPSTNPQEIKEIINLQAARHTPYSREEIIVDYIDLGTYKNNYTKILLVIVLANAIKKHFDILERLGLRVQRVSFAAEAIASSCSKVLKVETRDHPVCVIHIDEATSDFTVVFNNKLLFLRSIAIGARNLKEEAEKYQPKFTEEIKKSLEAYQNEDIERMPLLFTLTGVTHDIKALEDALNDTVRLPTKVVSYFSGIPVSQEFLQSSSIVTQATSFLNTIAPLFSSQEIKVDLMPEEIKLRKNLEQRAKDLIVAGILTLAFFILIFFTLLSKIYFKTYYLNNISARYEPINKEAQKLQKDFDKVSLIKNYLSKRGFSLEVLTELYDIIPLEVEINDVRFDDQGRFTLRGTAESMSVVFSFVDSLERSKYFKDVKTKYTTKRKEGNKDFTDFEINCSLEKKANT